MNVINIAIDGPSGAGKSTIAKRAASRFGIIYVDTGALYRAIGVNVLRQGLDTADPAQVEETLKTVEISLRFIGGEQRVFLRDEDVSEAIRRHEASMAASNVSAVPAVREFLFGLQKDIARKNSCVMDGRDIGTVVLPDAQIKIFLTASAEVRAKRRFDELRAKGSSETYGEVLEDMIKRDYNDSNRAVAPLRQADDAVLIDTTGLTLEQSVQAVIDVIEGRKYFL
ncbi:MAG: (d)CMP kinase [Oscillospiraceae bacterium]|nr:(d)CMP kinase [Oscillospiraceae bacterium]